MVLPTRGDYTCRSATLFNLKTVSTWCHVGRIAEKVHDEGMLEHIVLVQPKHDRFGKEPRNHENV